MPVELEKRRELVNIIERDGITIKEAANILNINYSTAKHIVKTFRRTGQLETQLMKKRKLGPTKPDLDVLEAMCR